LSEARSFLARFLFTGDDVFKTIGELSGGERSRVALAKLVLQRANFLLLDEPTNHLDIPSQEVLEEVLDGFAGTILLVTHDRYLVDRLATQLWIIDPNEQELQIFQGTWAEYVQNRNGATQAEEVRETKEKWTTDQRQLRRQEKRARREEEDRQERAAAMESEIQHLEAQLEALQQEISAATEAQETMRLYELGTLYGELEGQLQEKVEAWGELAA
jgi:ATP-binding cassette subfamily F protein 3